MPSPVLSRPAPDLAHPALWRAHQLGRAGAQGRATVPSGWPPLDAELPGGGWPCQGLTELLLAQAGIGELRLLAPALAALQQQGQAVMLFGAPALPCAWTLRALGLRLDALVLVGGLPQQADAGLKTPRGQVDAGLKKSRWQIDADLKKSRWQVDADLQWALEQALRSGQAGAVLAWLPAHLRPEALRRLALAAQAHEAPVFVLRGLAAQAQASAALLRLRLAPGGPDELQLHIIKRRGPPLARALHLPLQPVLPEAARMRARQGRAGVAVAGEVVLIDGAAGAVDDNGSTDSADPVR